MVSVVYFKRLCIWKGFAYPICCLVRAHFKYRIVYAKREYDCNVMSANVCVVKMEGVVFSLFIIATCNITHHRSQIWLLNEIVAQPYSWQKKKFCAIERWNFVLSFTCISSPTLLNTLWSYGFHRILTCAKFITVFYVICLSSRCLFTLFYHRTGKSQPYNIKLLLHAVIFNFVSIFQKSISCDLYKYVEHTGVFLLFINVESLYVQTCLKTIIKIKAVK